MKNPASLLEPVETVTGPGDWDVPERLNPRTFLLGDCVRERYRGLGTFIGGCPVNVGEFMQSLAEMRVVCSQCELAVQNAIESLRQNKDDYPDITAILPDIRILASNKTVFQGENNRAEMDDFVFAAGKCLSGYIRNHGRRVHKISDIDVSEYSVFKNGCPIDENDVIDGLRELIDKMDAMKNKTVCP